MQPKKLSGEGRFPRAAEAMKALPSAGQTQPQVNGHAICAIEGPDNLASDLRAKLQNEGRSEHADSPPPVADVLQTELQGEGLRNFADEAHRNVPIALQSHGGEEGRFACAQGRVSHADLAPTIAAIRYHHRTRNYAMEQRKRADLSLGAFLRMALGWSKALPEADRKRIAAQADALIRIGETVAKGKPAGIDEPAYAEWRHVIAASLAARAPFDEIEKSSKKEMVRLAESLPVWSLWAEGVRGFGAASLAVIVGEAGDLSQYPKKGHLWKRMGLAVMGDGDGVNDVRQGGLSKGAKAEAWIEHGYSAVRRSKMFVIGDCMVKTGDVYRQIYLRRKEVERGKTPDAKPIVLHRRAQRYMEKILLRDLWKAWRAARTPEAA